MSRLRHSKFKPTTVEKNLTTVGLSTGIEHTPHVSSKVQNDN